MGIHGRTRKIGSLGFILGIFIATSISYPAYGSQYPEPQVKIKEPAQKMQVVSVAQATVSRDEVSVESAVVRASLASSKYAGALPAGNSAIIQTALAYIGVPYVYAGSSPSGFDCSGFTMFVYAQHGVALPHSSTAQAAMGYVISEANAVPGDLVIYPGHVGLWYAPGLMIDAPVPGQYVGIHAMWPGYQIYRIG